MGEGRKDRVRERGREIGREERKKAGMSEGEGGRGGGREKKGWWEGEREGIMLIHNLTVYSILCYLS